MKSLYLIEFSNGTTKVGVTQDVKKRISHHRSHARSFGITISQVWASEPHASAENNESAIKGDSELEFLTRPFSNCLTEAQSLLDSQGVHFVKLPPKVKKTKPVPYQREDYDTENGIRGEILAELNKRGWTISRFATILGRRRGTLYRKLQGSNPVTFDDLQEYSAAFGIPAWELVRRAEHSEVAA